MKYYEISEAYCTAPTIEIIKAKSGKEALEKYASYLRNTDKFSNMIESWTTYRNRSIVNYDYPDYPIFTGYAFMAREIKGGLKL